MSKLLRNLTSTIEYLKTNNSTLPDSIFDSLDDIKVVLESKSVIKHCKKCKAKTHYNEDLGLWSCNECEWQGQVK